LPGLRQALPLCAINSESMLTIEIKRKKYKDEENSTRIKEILVVNGIRDEDSHYIGGHPSGHLYNDEVIDILTSHSFAEVGKSLKTFNYGVEVEWWDNSIDIDVYCGDYFNHTIPSIQLNMQLQEWEHWAKPWSMSSVAKEIESTINLLNNKKIKYWQDDPDSMLNGFGIEYFPESENLPIEGEVDYLLGVLKTVVENTTRSLATTIDSEVVLTYFQFPEEIKTACKQYLIYFTQFIADMGILVDTELKEELNHTLFKIIPQNKEESLHKIREALNIYLNAPNSKDFEISISTQNDIAAKQWEANTYHLKSQLALATSILQAKESTIEMLQLTNYQYKQLLESHTAKKDDDKEDLIKGIVSVKKFEGKGFSIDFAEIFRRLKRSIKR
jgi:hypothetical protein